MSMSLLSIIKIVNQKTLWVGIIALNTELLCVCLPGIASGGNFPVASIISLKLSEL